MRLPALIKLFNKYNEPRLKRLNDPNHPLIVLQALPSNGETLCWNFHLFEDVRDNSMIATLEMPSFGLTRIGVYDWNDGTQFVGREQVMHRYEQNVQIPGRSNPIPHTEARPTLLLPTDQLNLMDVRVRSD